MTSNCQIKECPTISCSSILSDADPGEVAKIFIETTFKMTCSRSESVKLSFVGCKFPSNTLRSNWLSTNASIEELTLDRCSLSEIEDEAFDRPIFKETKKIILVRNQLSSLRKAMFRKVNALEEFTMRKNIIKYAELNLLEHVASTLTILELSEVIDDYQILRNITGGTTPLKIQILSLRGNAITVINRELFEGITQVESLYLDNSKVEYLSQDALQPMATSISQLIINNNNIRSFPEGLFDSVLYLQKPFRVTIQNNPWNCDCSMQWMRNLIQTYPQVVTSVPVCSTPKENSGKSFNVATFCPTDTTSTARDCDQSTVEVPETSELLELEDIELNCTVPKTILQMSDSRRVLSTDVHFPPRLHDFYVLKTEDQSLLINLPDLEEGVMLLWFDNDDVDRSLNCAKNVKHSYLLQGIDPQTTYTICLLNDNDTSFVSPLNCLAVTTNPTYEASTWLTNADKSAVFLSLTVSLLLMLAIGAFIAFVLIWRNPSLLRGSKRVMLVKRRNVDAIVLPKGVNVDEEKRVNGNVAYVSNKMYEDGYITPLPPRPIPPRRERVSRVSLQSDWNSYVSDFEHSELLDSWKTVRLNSETERQKCDAPAVPPHPFIPSVSMTVASTDDNFVYRATV
ncbi:leucine-rich repeat transmembrane protein FLRT3-like [Hylaeus volcanicus]|uniref:leucine-rich repeat transmembrane protein FLRT3-like n=1 Tax=Hylaeus volcanicus TaxID=313075 RepID=UPI0023B79364|nr:leucine-rich repeat transmembrane protein FLRT3-like [Hylaeus volcanicus]